jgi:hypothetical protein
MKLKLRPRYTFHCESSGRDIEMQPSWHLEVELKPEHLGIIQKEGLKAFVGRLKLSILPYKEVLDAALKEHGATNAQELADKDAYATNSEFVEGVRGVYGGFFNDVLYGHEGLVPPLGVDDIPSLDDSYWPEGRKFTGFRVEISEDGPPILRCIEDCDIRWCYECGKQYDLLSDEKQAAGGNPNFCAECVPPLPIPIGQKVTHKKFGSGEVLTAEHGKYFCNVRFEDKTRRVKINFLTAV